MYVWRARQSDPIASWLFLLSLRWFPFAFCLLPSIASSSSSFPLIHFASSFPSKIWISFAWFHVNASYTHTLERILPIRYDVLSIASSPSAGEQTMEFSSLGFQHPFPLSFPDRVSLSPTASMLMHGFTVFLSDAWRRREETSGKEDDWVNLSHGFSPLLVVCVCIYVIQFPSFLSVSSLSTLSFPFCSKCLTCRTFPALRIVRIERSERETNAMTPFHFHALFPSVNTRTKHHLSILSLRSAFPPPLLIFQACISCCLPKKKDKKGKYKHRRQGEKDKKATRSYRILSKELADAWMWILQQNEATEIHTQRGKADTYQGTKCLKREFLFTNSREVECRTWG